MIEPPRLFKTGFSTDKNTVLNYDIIAGEIWLFHYHVRSLIWPKFMYNVTSYQRRGCLVRNILIIKNVTCAS